MALSARLMRRGLWLEYFTVGWNALEGLAAVVFLVSIPHHPSHERRTPVE